MWLDGPLGAPRQIERKTFRLFSCNFHPLISFSHFPPSFPLRFSLFLAFHSIYPAYVLGSFLTPISWGLHVAAWIQKSNGK